MSEIEDQRANLRANLQTNLRANLQAAIAALEAQRELLGEAVVETAIKPLQEKLAALESPLPPGEPQLKLITILFSDIVGSTQFSQHLDPDDIQAILDGALQRFEDAINRRGGRVVRFMGDGLKAVFGAPLSSENDAERAVLAGLDLIQAAGEYERSLQSDWGIERFTVRVGINTGQVLLGGGVEADNNAVGMAVNLGARMESLASPGCVLITQKTYEHVRGIFDVEAQPLAQVKGSDKPVRTYIVRGKLAGSFRNPSRGLEGLETPLVGRQAEMSRLQEHFLAAAQTRESRLVTLVGDPGVGKSRLMLEFESWVAASETGAVLQKGRCSEVASNQPYSLLRSLFGFSFNILESDSLEAMRYKLERGLSEHLTADREMKVHFIGALSGYDFSDSPHLQGVQNDPKQIRERALYYLGEFFKALTEHNLVVLLLDDLHWADTSSLQAIASLIRDCQGLFILCSARQTFFEKYPHWGSQETLGEKKQDLIRLEALPVDDSSRLINYILKSSDPIPDWLYRMIQSQTEGNPYYIEEIIKNLIEESVLVRNPAGEGWQIDVSRLGEVKIPTTLTALLQARLDRLPAEEKRTIQQASVVGRIFWDAVLALIGSRDLSANVDDQALPELTALQRRGLVYPQDQSAFAGTHEYSFKHSLLRETAYQTLLKTNRKAYHARVAEWLLNISQASQRGDEYAAVIAGHFDKAGENELAAEWYLHAGKLALAKASAHEALAFYDRALELISSSQPSQRWQGLLGRSEALGILGETGARLLADQELVTQAHALDDERALGEAYYRQGFYLGRTGDFAGESLAYDRAIEYASRAGDHNLEAQVLGLKAILLTRQADLTTATRIIDKALTYARESNRDEILVQILNNAGFIFSEAGDMGQSIQFFNEGVQVSARLGNPHRAITCLGNLGYNYLQLGLFEKAHEILQGAVDQGQSNGYLHNCVNAQLNISLCLIRLKKFDLALALLDRTGEEASRLGDTFSQVICHTYIGLALEEKGQVQDARAHFTRAYAALEELGVHSYAVDAQAGLARCSLLENQPEKARLEADHVWQYLERSGSTGLEAPILAYLTCARVFAAAGEPDLARRAVEKGIADLTGRLARIKSLELEWSYMNNLPEHQQILELGRAQGLDVETKSIVEES